MALQIVAARLPLAGVRVLVVDDEASARAVVKDVLEAEGAAVSTASSAAEALDELHEPLPDVMVSDLAMPVEDGFTLVERLRRRDHARGGDVPCIALTGYLSSEDRDRASRVGFQTYLVKPADPADLVEAVQAQVHARDR